MADYTTPTPYEEKFVEVDGLKLHYLDYGTAGKPVMLCLHGGQAHAHWYDFVAKEFTGDFHVIALDNRGHGDSEWSKNPPDYTYGRFAEDLNAVAEALDLKDFTLVGHSVGGVSALLYAAKYHNRMKRVLMIDSTFTTNPKRVEMMRGKAKQPKPAYESEEALIEAYKLNPPKHFAPQAVVDYLAGFDAEQGEDGLWRQKFDPEFYAQRDWDDPYSSWDTVQVPVLLMKAADSDRISDEVVAEVTKRCPTVTLTGVSGCDHHVMLDQPEAYVAEVKKFIAAT